MQGLYEKVIEELQIINQKLIVKNDYLCVDRQTLLEKNMKLEEEN